MKKYCVEQKRKTPEKECDRLKAHFLNNRGALPFYFVLTEGQSPMSPSVYLFFVFWSDIRLPFSFVIHSPPFADYILITTKW